MTKVLPYMTQDRYDRSREVLQLPSFVLENEYLRDKNQGLPIHVPENYYPNDDDTQEPIVRWRSHANLLFSNWLNYFVYQTTPYDISEIKAGTRTE